MTKERKEKKHIEASLIVSSWHESRSQIYLHKYNIEYDGTKMVVNILFTHRDFLCVITARNNGNDKNDTRRTYKSTKMILKRENLIRKRIWGIRFGICFTDDWFFPTVHEGEEGNWFWVEFYDQKLLLGYGCMDKMLLSTAYDFSYGLWIFTAEHAFLWLMKWSV